jgi:hypothetical protein
MIQVIGYSTLRLKPRGNAGIVFFKDQDRFMAEKPPTEAEMRSFAVAHGYPLVVENPGPGLIAREPRPACEPVYIYI